MPHPLIVSLLLAALFVVCTCAAAGWSLGREREVENGGSEADAPEGPAAPLPRQDEGQPIADLRGPLSGLGERLGNVAAKFRTLADTNQQLSTQIKSRTSQLHQAQAEIGRLKDEREQRLAQHKTFQAQLQEREQELERTAAQTRALEIELARVRERLSLRISELEARVAGGQLESAQQTETLALAERRAAELERSLAARIIALEAELARREGEFRQLAGESRAVQEQSSSRIGELEAQLVQREAELQRRAQEQFQAELRASERIEALDSQLVQRDAELEQQSQEQRQAEARALEREQAQSARIGALEAQLEQREAQLEERTQEQRLSEARALEREEAQSARICGLETKLAASVALLAQLEQQSQEGRQAAARASELERTQSARIAELEVELAQRAADLHEHTTELEGLLQEIVVQSSVGDERARRCASLEEELRQRVEELSRSEARLGERSAELEGVRADLARGSSQGEALARHCAELEERLSVREEQLRALHGDCLALAEGGAARDAALEARAEELRERERRMNRLDARVRELELAAAESAAQSRADLAAIDEIAMGRLVTALEGTAGASPVPLPEAYLAGIEQRDLALALCGLLGGPEPLSGPALLRLSAHWREQHADSKFERIEGEVVYLWADAPFVRTGLEPEGSALLVIVAGLSDGTRRVLAVDVAARDSETAWLGALEELVRRGMNIPRLVVGEDGLGVWPALESLGWNCAQQRCWDRRIEHVVDALPKRQQRLAGEQLRKLAKAKTRAEANRMKDAFVARHKKRRPEAVARIEADWEHMVGLYSFPADHWPHLRGTAVVESLLSPLRLQTSLPKPGTPTPNASSILWKLLLVGARGLRKLNSPELLPAVAAAERCVDGVLGGKKRKRRA